MCGVQTAYVRTRRIYQLNTPLRSKTETKRIEPPFALWKLLSEEKIANIFKGNDVSFEGSCQDDVLLLGCQE